VVARFEDIDFDAEFDGIWACASLLHAPRAALPDVLRRCMRALRRPGAMYVSFKHGSETRVQDGRIFTDLAEPDLQGLLNSAGLRVADLWLTDDVRPGRTDRWINAISVTKANPAERRR